MKVNRKGLDFNSTVRKLVDDPSIRSKYDEIDEFEKSSIFRFKSPKKFVNDNTIDLQLEELHDKRKGISPEKKGQEVIQGGSIRDKSAQRYQDMDVLLDKFDRQLAEEMAEPQKARLELLSVLNIYEPTIKGKTLRNKDTGRNNKE
jgi:hypothetical protein